MKIIEGVGLWEVVRAAEAKQKWAYFCGTNANSWNENPDQSVKALFQFVLDGYAVAIIDTSQPELTTEWWDGIDWGFFDK